VTSTEVRVKRLYRWKIAGWLLLAFGAAKLAHALADELADGYDHREPRPRRWTNGEA